MRFRIEDGGQIVEQTSTDGVLLLTCVIGIFIGALLAWAGWRGRQWWLVFWCGGLVPVSILTIIWEVGRTGS